MRTITKYVGTSLTALAVTGLAGISSAVADPDNGHNAFPVVLDCDNGQVYETVVAGNGDFSVAHDLNSRKILVPLAFGEFTGRVLDSDGNVVEEFTEPASTKGKANKKQRRTRTTCTYVVGGTETDPETGETFTFQGAGSVIGFVTPPRRR